MIRKRKFLRKNRIPKGFIKVYEDESLEMSINMPERLIKINNTKYTMTLFEEFGENGMTVGETFEIVKREDGVFTIEVNVSHIYTN